MSGDASDPGHPSAQTLEAVQVEQRSDVVAGGVRHEQWRVRVGDAWLSLKDCVASGRGVRRPDSEAPSGCQYRMQYELRLPRGTLLERRISDPLRLQGVDIDSFLSRPHREQRRVQRTSYRVAPGGRLQREPSDDKPGA